MAMQTTIQAHPLVEGEAAPWRMVEERLAEPEPKQMYWLATIDPDGRPHVMPILGLWVDRAFYFLSGPSTHKGRNLERDGRCVVCGSSTALPSIDIILEGDAHHVSDEAKLRRVVDAFAGINWPLEVRGDAVEGQNAPTAGPPPYSVFELVPSKAFGLPGVTGMEETPEDVRVTPTRWRFP